MKCLWRWGELQHPVRAPAQTFKHFFKCFGCRRHLSGRRPKTLFKTLNTLTNTLRTSPNVLDNRVKELNLDLNKVYNRKELQDSRNNLRGTL